MVKHTQIIRRGIAEVGGEGGGGGGGGVPGTQFTKILINSPSLKLRLSP